MVTQAGPQTQKAYQHCLEIVRSHYENFPVASLLLPRSLRQPIAAIYAFARTADDFADEGQLSEAQRLEKLNHYSRQLETLDQEQPADPVFIALRDVIHRRHLPMQLFQDLLTAFKQDVTKKRYDNFDEVLQYCRYSANPVGRLLLHITGHNTALNLQQSDAICSALQLINFLQDVVQDYEENNRIYFPRDEMRQWGVTESMIQHQQTTGAMRALVQQQVQRTKAMLLSGAPLGSAIAGRFGLQLRIMINGGLRILKLLENQQENVFSRPRLKTMDWLAITYYAVLKKPIT
ncbi:MAG: squalene synthase HpnC [Gammaproteobacteria bacterium]|nr:squalene synthase HpnC [Gammaproteobacteria bacterium]